MAQHTYVIAEAGSCHKGDLTLAYECIGAAKNAGADAVKFQWTSDPIRMAGRRNVGPGAYMRLRFPQGWHVLLAYMCDNAGIDYMCTVYLPEDIAVVAPYVAKFKISSFEARDTGFLNAHVILGSPKERIISTGMMTSAEVERTRPYGKLLHCVSSYPARLESMNLATIRALGLCGLSDHSAYMWMGGLAVAAGAHIVEVHMKLDSTTEDDPDYKHSWNPVHLGAYIANIRLVEKIVGDGHKSVQDDERPNMKYRVVS